MNYKRLLITSVLALSALTSVGVRAQPVVSGSYNGTNYDFTTITGSYNEVSGTISSQPWTGNWTGAFYVVMDNRSAFASAFGTSNNLGYGDTGGPIALYGLQNSETGYLYGNATYSNGYTNLWGGFSSYQYTWLVVSPVTPFTSTAPLPPTSNSGGGSIGAPEIDGSLAPLVGFLLAGFFMIFVNKRGEGE